MRTPVVIPWRGPGPGRPDVPLPPARMPLVRRGRPLKRWVWVGAFAPEAIVCAAHARVGGVPASWWSVLDRRTGVAVSGRGGVRAGPSELRVRGRGVAVELALERGAVVEAVSPHGRGYAWTRKAGGVSARGAVEVGGLRRTLDARAIVDESAGHHARRTAWRWSAGVGRAASGALVAWNLVAGLHDAPEASERTVWVDGEPHEVGPVEFGAGLDRVVGKSSPAAPAAPWSLTCAPEHELRERRGGLLVRSELEQRVGAVTGSLPVVGQLAAAWGVMERHDARW